MYYNLRRMPDGYRMVKFDFLFNVEAVYYIRFSRGRFYCDCPAYKNVSCKHRDMVPIFLDHKAVDSGKFLCYDTGEWHPMVEGLTEYDIDIQVQKLKRDRKSIRPTRKTSRRYEYR